MYEAETGTMFMGFGMMLVFITVAFFMYVITIALKRAFDRDYQYDVLESCLLTKVALKKGIDINKEIERTRIIKGSKFRKRLHEEMFKEMFGKE